MKSIILAALVFAVACVVAGLILVNRPVTPDPGLPAKPVVPEAAPDQAAGASRVAAPPEEVSSASAPVAVTAPPSPAPPRTPPAEPAKAAANAPSGAAPPGPGGRPGKPPPQNPLARVALAFVGADPVADEYWYAAINDPTLPATERQDLIEDLNEDGLSDPKHPGPEDLPLILTRLQMLERITPQAMDQVNADAGLEAYQDLWRLARIAAGSGEQIR